MRRRGDGKLKLEVIVEGRFTLAAGVALAIALCGQTTRAQGTEPSAGQALYLKNCRQCHGTKGTPPKTMKKKFERIPDLSDAEFMGKRSDDSVVVVIRKGVKEEQDMKGFSGKLTLEEMQSIAKYVRTLSVKPK